MIDLDAKKRIDYKDNYVAFLDVLGFKDMLNSGDKEKLENYFGIVESAISHLQSIDAKKEIDYIVISDSIILTMPFGDSDESISNLRNLIVAIGLIQHGLALQNIWLRGAISYGETYFKDNQIVGQGFVNAYLLESMLALYPRVIIDNKIINKLSFNYAQELIDVINNFSFDNWDGNYLFSWERSIISFEKDLPLFIDYLGVNNSLDAVCIDLIDNIEKTIYKNNDLYKKFKWVANYLAVKLNRLDSNNSNIKRLLGI